MLMCKLRYFVKCAESTFCSLSLPGFGNVVISWGGERDGDGVTSISREGRWKQCVFISFSVRHWKLAQTDVTCFEQVCNLPVFPEMGELQSCNCPAVRAGAWQRFGLNWKWIMLFDYFMLLIPASLLPVPQDTRTNETCWRRGPWKFRKIRMVLNGLFGSVHVQDSPCPSLKSQSPATLEKVSVLKNIWVSMLLTLDNGFKKILPS